MWLQSISSQAHKLTLLRLTALSEKREPKGIAHELIVSIQS